MRSSCGLPKRVVTCARLALTMALVDEPAVKYSGKLEAPDETWICLVSRRLMSDPYMRQVEHRGYSFHRVDASALNLVKASTRALYTPDAGVKRRIEAWHAGRQPTHAVGLSAVVKEQRHVWWGHVTFGGRAK